MLKYKLQKLITSAGAKIWLQAAQQRVTERTSVFFNKNFIHLFLICSFVIKKINN